MAWPTPRTWLPRQFVTAAMMNEIRDALLLLKTNVDDGSLRTLKKGFAFSAGEGNGAGSVDTALSSYDVTFGPNSISQPGDAVLLMGTLSLANNANTKLFKVDLPGGPRITLLSSAAAVAGHIVPFRYIVRRRTETTGVVTGVAYVGAAAGGAPTNYMVHAPMTGLNFGAFGGVTVALYANAPTANDIRLTDYFVANLRGLNGVTV